MKIQNSRERVFNTISGLETDRVPMSELLITPTVFEKLYPGKSYYDFVELVDYDLVGPNTTWDAIGIVEWIDKEKKIFIDRWGITRRFTTEVIPVPIEGAINSKSDLLSLKIPDPAEEPLLKMLPELISRFKDKKATFILGRDAWTGSYCLRGMVNLLIDLIEDPKFAKDIIRINIDYFKEVHRLAINQGIDIIHLVDDYAFKSGTLMSPKLWQQFIYPGLCEIVEDIKKHGALCFKHTDGNIHEIIDLIVDSGVDAIGPLEPEAGMILSEVKEKYGDRVAVIGNVSVDLLSRGTPEEICKAVKSLMESTAKGGKFILSSGNTISSGVRPENLAEMIRSAKEFGKYNYIDSPKSI